MNIPSWGEQDKAVHNSWFYEKTAQVAEVDIA
jgi:hypothetical protein